MPSIEIKHARDRSRGSIVDRDSDLDDTPLLYKDKEIESGPSPPKWRSKPRFVRRLLPLVLIVAVMVCGGLTLMGRVPVQLPKARFGSPDLTVRLRLLHSRMEQYYTPTAHRWRERYTLPPLKRLIECVEANSCTPSEGQIVILASTRFSEAKDGAVSGENIWAASTIRAFEAMNTTLLFTTGAMDTLLAYQHVPELVKLVIWEGVTFKNCQARNGTISELDKLMQDDYDRAPADWQGGSLTEQGCMVRDAFPDGIPYWKSLVFHFWGDPRSPLGREFTLAPWDFSSIKAETNRYLGFSIEDHCMNHRYYPPAEREHQALILGKLIKYFEQPLSWITPDMLRDSVKELPKGDNGDDFKLISTAMDNWKDRNTAVLPEPIISKGFQTQGNWTQLLARSKVLVSPEGREPRAQTKAQTLWNSPRKSYANSTDRPGMAGVQPLSVRCSVRRRAFHQPDQICQRGQPRGPRRMAHAERRSPLARPALRLSRAERKHDSAQGGAPERDQHADTEVHP